MDEIYKRLSAQIDSVINTFHEELSGVRTNRPNAGMVDGIKVSYYDQMTPLKHLGSVSVVPPRELHVQVWDASAIPLVIKAIEASSLGLSVTADGNVIRLFLPELSGERREELVKHVKKIAEQYKIQIRHWRDEFNKEVQKNFDAGDIAEDARFRSREEIQKIIDAGNGKIEALLESKIAEVKE
ncbi:ribosome recycling factor [Candidatus Jorgensenbacteria bacterium RIFCSPLOWO2_02_FULL_45_12]|uniref:Ribosome recycling factor n=2 Tax=Candidatus Joergenseniibacteriota TaxID=1752739 RepID=A0A1F6BP51_9BACT|nr:MAG: Ribosome-recycling factor [Candidatus Jorgensenbacteria bacterium GW2011_GWA2_45_9]OGG38648.1 MAG: ribosome recycling factor [Candidatus Jorgensenbacteria bacterium RIFCSPHIGHO2_02_FULL_45_20]OGG42584.1 MAG: ribosome recycling factor [Candidatus Jorgensenbacteria bacterium RIFCSPLOWO2_02_FULL_45_12]